MKYFLKKRIPFLINIYRLIWRELDRLQPKRMTHWGFYLSGNKQMANGEFEVTETKLFLKLLNDIDLFINVGANIGYYCCHALNKNVDVIAFEPMENNLYYLYRNIKDNNWKNIEVYPVALSEKNEIATIYGDNTGASLIPGWSNFEPSFKKHLSVFELDRLNLDYYREKRKLVLIDIEGAEYEMLKGAEKLLNSEISPIILIEIAYYGYKDQDKEKINLNYYKTFKLFFNYGYKGFEIKDTLVPITTKKINDLEEEKKSFNSYNFLFRK